jgi:hypothetical protein
MCPKHTTMSLHAIGPFRKHLDNKLLVLVPPSPHVLVRVNNSADKLDNVLLLSELVMEAYAVRCRCQRLKGSSDVDFGSTSNAKM